MKITTLLLPSFVLCISGCTTVEYWNHSTKDPNEFQKDQAYCINIAIKAVPNIAVPAQAAEIRPPQPTSYDTSCSQAFGGFNCRTKANVGPISAFERYQVSPQAQMNAAVEQTRASYVETCLVQMGWKKLDPETVRNAQNTENQYKSNLEAARKQLSIDVQHYTEKICKSDKYIEVTKLAPCSIPDINAGHLSNSEYINKAQKDLFVDISIENTKMNDSVINFYKNYANPSIRDRLIEVQVKKRSRN